LGTDKERDRTKRGRGRYDAVELGSRSLEDVDWGAGKEKERPLEQPIEPTKREEEVENRAERQKRKV
jgi:hypothetical protein